MTSTQTEPAIESIALRELVPYASNPRTHPPANVAKLAESLKQYGWTNPVLITDAKEIIAGHGRVLAANKLGLTEAPCIRLSHLTPEQVKAYRIADNRLGFDSDWDDELLRLELANIDLDCLLTGFDELELDRILNANGAQEGEDNVPPLQEMAVSATGEIWQLANHRLLCADSTDAVQVPRLLDDVKPTLMVTDPPYGIDYDPVWLTQPDFRNRFLHRRNAASGKSVPRKFEDVPNRISVIKKPDNDTRSDWSAAWSLFPGDVAYTWHPSGNLQFDHYAALIYAGFTVRAQIIWVKDNFVLSRCHYHPQHEACWYAVRAKAHWKGDNAQTTVWKISNLVFNRGAENRKENERVGLSVQKPVECMRRPILNHTSEGQAVYDPFMGSGTTIIAAETIGRVCYGVEINPLYVDMAIRRWQTFTKQIATRLGDNKPFDG